jgi:hypothetical protein
VRPSRVRRAVWIALLCAPAAGGCANRDRPAAAAARPATAGADLGGDSGADQTLAPSLSKLINDVTSRYSPLDYQYDEDLLEKVDRFEAELSGRASGPPHRLFPKLTAEEERDHLRETVRRWEAKTGGALRPAIEPLKAEVAARQPSGPRFYPDFHRHCRAVFDDLIRIEVGEMLERRNRAVHAGAASLLDPYRATHPELVGRYEASLDHEYRVPPPTHQPSP